MRRSSILMLVLGTIALVAGPASAATTTVNIANLSFTPPVVRVALGGSVNWHNTTTITTHTSTQDQGVWDTGLISGGLDASKVLAWAATYPYHCSRHLSMTGTVKVPVKVSPTLGGSTTTFTITFAAAALPTGFTTTVQERVGTGPWVNYKTGLTGTSTTFKTSIAGTYSFRSLLVGASVQTKASPLRSITVS